MIVKQMKEDKFLACPGTYWRQVSDKEHWTQLPMSGTEEGELCQGRQIKRR